MRWIPNILITVVAALLLASCSIRMEGAVQKEENDQSPYKISAWAVEWQEEAGLEEVRQAAEGIDDLLLFGAYFSGNGGLLLTDSAKRMLDTVFTDERLEKQEKFLTIVNDRFLAPGQVEHKNPELIRTVLSDAESESRHIDEILRLASAYPLDGIELDYENVPTDLAGQFINFIKRLDERLADKQLKLRVVLEPGFPADRLSLPAGVGFTVMAYNLHGFHSGPGPKADEAFLDQLMDRFPNVNNNISFAFSTGGFAWKDGSATALTELQAIEFAGKANNPPDRDSGSQALSFQADEDGAVSEVWYADAETIRHWMEYMHKCGGYKGFSIWRMGGLSGPTLNMLEEL
ncbi:glycosyl hydrolase family 18 protein [Bhargavaea cecembensis]|uniref:glycosyl hydrolase family 18 protein n=1 Tax=Bhargavaea cecembensis TaxID=394098 RepID=UPI0006935609|nr:glycosyl hydrolase family 18 protein [Bhargavaea cecembensis]